MRACEPTRRPAAAVKRYVHSLSTMLARAAHRAMVPGMGGMCPLMACATARAASQHIMAPTMSSAMPMMAVARVSYLPWPYSWSLSSGLLLMRTNTTTMMSVMKSDSECTASAIIAADPPTMPAVSFRASSAALTMLPPSVTRYMVRWRAPSGAVLWVVLSDMMCSI